MTPQGQTTAKPLGSMRDGDHRAFERFFERHAGRILVYINYNMGDRLRRKLDPADILQDIYLRVCRDPNRFCERVEERGSQRVLIRMADHAITEAFRYHFKVEKRDACRERAAAFLDSDGQSLNVMDWVPSDATTISARVVRNEEYQRVMRMLRHLSPLEQYVTVARVIENVPAREIAERVGKSRGAIQMIVARVRDKLRARMGVDPETGEDDTRW